MRLLNGPAMATSRQAGVVGAATPALAASTAAAGLYEEEAASGAGAVNLRSRK